MCESIDARSICTEACTPASGTCTGALVCRESGFCGPSCTSAPSGEVCMGGVLVACSTLTDAQCGACGCGPFGGGTCVSGVGCVHPMPDGSACTRAEDCTNVCDPETHTCISARAQGTACHYDAQCATGNCSNDGAVTTAGVCNPMLGSTCMQADDCTECVGWDHLTQTGFCSRAACDPTNAPHCAGGWICESSTDGGHHCYEECDYSAGIGGCHDPFAYCHSDNRCY